MSRLKCLFRFVFSGDEIVVPVTIRVAVPADENGGVEEVSTLHLKAPCLLPPLHWIRAIIVDSPRYWPLQLVSACCGKLC